MMAIAALREPRRMVVREVARGEAMERIDRLQEEVARIARLLGDLAGQRGLPGTPADHGVRGEGQGDHAGKVRAPGLDCRGDPSSLEPQDSHPTPRRPTEVRRQVE